MWFTTTISLSTNVPQKRPPRLTCRRLFASAFVLYRYLWTASSSWWPIVPRKIQLPTQVNSIHLYWCKVVFATTKHIFSREIALPSTGSICSPSSLELQASKRQTKHPSAFLIFQKGGYANVQLEQCIQVEKQSTFSEPSMFQERFFYWSW